jgi:hypothetical protein
MKPNIENLKVGMKFKTFKQLVEFVELEYREGGYAVMLLKNKLAKYIEFEYDINEKTGRKKQSLTITKIK